MEVGIDADEINDYEATLNTVNSITDDMLEGDGEEASYYRQELIFKDLIDKGFSEEDATSWVERSIKLGTDLEDAKRARQSIFHNTATAYKARMEAQKEAHKQSILAEQKKVEDLRNSILNTEELLPGLKISKGTREKVVETMIKPVYVDETNGRSLNAIQRFNEENPMEFQKIVSTFYVMTNGFKDFNKILGSVKKATESKMVNDFEKILKTTDLSTTKTKNKKTKEYQDDYDFDIDI